mmetsp:Transcript_104335/g.238937  ORF Transcript_104335/g.238937 Transcript_104335/m.238937 type:complete len:161 (+) Transcript_104335:356-838(+)
MLRCSWFEFNALPHELFGGVAAACLVAGCVSRCQLWVMKTPVVFSADPIGGGKARAILATWAAVWISLPSMIGGRGGDEDPIARATCPSKPTERMEEMTTTRATKSKDKNNTAVKQPVDKTTKTKKNITGMSTSADGWPRSRMQMIASRLRSTSENRCRR